MFTESLNQDVVPILLIACPKKVVFLSSACWVVCQLVGYPKVWQKISRTFFWRVKPQAKNKLLTSNLLLVL